MSNWVNGHEVPDFDVTVGEHGEVTSWPDPAGAARDRAALATAVIRAFARDSRLNPDERSARLAASSDDPGLSPDAARWTPEDNG